MSGQDDDVAPPYRTSGCSQTATDHHDVEIPPFDRPQIAFDLEPDFPPGDVYLPARNSAGMTAAIGFHTAGIGPFLDRSREGQTATRSNHLRPGKAVRNYAALRHIYRDDGPISRAGSSGKLRRAGRDRAWLSAPSGYGAGDLKQLGLLD